MKQNKELICKLCKKEIPDESVAFKMIDEDGYCCIECYMTKGVISQKILKELREEDIRKKYGEGATSERRVFGKKDE